MIKDQEHICIALSGGIDSVVLLFTMFLIREYTHLTFQFSALHIRTSDYETDILKKLCRELDTSYLETDLNYKKDTTDKNICYTCSRMKRGAISETLNRLNIKTCVLGHHADDVCETFFMNIVHNKKLGSFSPKVVYDNNDVTFIRPMIYLTKKRIIHIHNHFELPLLNYQCPHEMMNQRTGFRQGIQSLDALFHTENFVEKTVASLENLDKTNLWDNLLK